MTDDRDLIAEGRAKLSALDESPSTDRAFDLALWAGKNLAILLAELEAQRERVNELAATRNPDDEVLVEGSWFHPDDLPKILGNHMRSTAEESRRLKDVYIELEKARARIAELEVAQRLPLGYVVGRQSVDGWVFKQFYGGPRNHAEAVGDLTAAVDEDSPAAGWQLLEVREVQP